jgi:lysozyme family protein
MADFNPCFEKVIVIEGGYKLTNIQGDSGGMTYAGISRTRNPGWEGWSKIDRGEFDDRLAVMVKAFYKKEFWDKIQGDVIGAQSVAYNLYEFGVNAGIVTSIKLCQRIIGVEVDGIFGPATLKALNAFVVSDKDEKIFVFAFIILKVMRYNYITFNDPRREHDLLVSNHKFLCGWLNRGTEAVAYHGLKYP